MTKTLIQMSLLLMSYSFPAFAVEDENFAMTIEKLKNFSCTYSRYENSGKQTTTPIELMTASGNGVLSNKMIFEGDPLTVEILAVPTKQAISLTILRSEKGSNAKEITLNAIINLEGRAVLFEALTSTQPGVVNGRINCDKIVN